MTHLACDFPVPAATISQLSPLNNPSTCPSVLSLLHNKLFASHTFIKIGQDLLVKHHKMSSTECPEQNARTDVMATTPSVGKYPQQSTVSTTPSTSKRGGNTATTLLALRNNKAVAAEDANTQMVSINTEPSTLTARTTSTVPTEPGATTPATDSEDGASDWAEAHSPNLYASGSEASKASRKRATESATRLKTTNGVKKAVKRARANSASSSTIGATPTKKKRVRTTALQRQAPSAQSNLPLGNGELA